MLRFTGSKITRDGEMVVKTIQQAIKRRDRRRNWREQQWQERQQENSPAPETASVQRRSGNGLIEHKM